MSSKVDVINERIDQASDILSELEQLTRISKAPRPSGVISIDPKTYYAPAKVDSILQSIKQWQFVTKEILIKNYGENSRYVRTFESSIVSTKMGFDYKKELTKEVNEGITALNSILESMAIIGDEAEEKKDMSKQERKPLVFISHSSKDFSFVESLVELLEGMGLDETNLFCSSIPGYWIGLSKNIFEVLRSKFIDCNLYVIFVQSPRFYQSPVSLNEMGAAWALKSEHCSILTQDMEFSAMTAVVNSHETAIKVNTTDAKARLTELKDALVNFIGIQDVAPIKWERIREKFLASVVSDYQSNLTTNDLSQEYQRLMIEKMKEEQDNKKKASVRGNAYPAAQRGTRIIKIFNAGKSTARNIRIEWLNPDNSVLLLKPFDTIEDLTPQNSREYRVALCIGCPDTMRLKYTWDDDFKEDNVLEESVQL